MSNIIEVKNLVKNYKDVHAVNDISFTVEEGSFFAFLGINGAGKSTTINILCTVLEKTSGNVKIGGYDLDKEKNKIKELIKSHTVNCHRNMLLIKDNAMFIVIHIW